MNKIVLSAILAMFLTACGDSEQTKQSTQTTVEKSEVVKEPAVVEKVEVEKVVTKDAEVVAVKTEVVEEKPVVQEVKAPVQTKEVVKAPVAEVKKEVVAVKESVTVAIDGAKLFVKCSTCHGQNGEKAALGKSQIIKGWSVDKVMNAFHGYKDGTYGGAMKGIMKTQIANYSEDELKALATHISKL